MDTAVANNVAEKLFSTELAIDNAMIESAQLLEAIISARQALNFSPLHSEVAQARVAESISALSESRRAIMASHAALMEMQRKLGIEVTAEGPICDFKCDPSDAQAEQVSLRVAR